MSFVKTAFFMKNVPNWERVVRILLAIAIVILSVSFLPSPWNWIVALSGACFGVTGVVGFCPACALVGRRLERNNQNNWL
ncbi:DUF2892 domain-containing protein [Dyella sp. C11]|uniref:YgaP family membrane protein n=1 Tax=Dyella sp. C11 TaxID=2126991 RepID=UPI00130051AA|nr:DUF2892 domain-containing protein [Dyella sp. C11]